MSDEHNAAGERLLTLLTINNSMMHAANALRAAGFRDEAKLLAELALGVWTVMCSVARTDQVTSTVAS